ncbi:MAG: STAS domain-containing protein [Bacteroidetes bacterium]|nr:STAS domain-containing protein [Bacteroidota bacterium]
MVNVNNQIEMDKFSFTITEENSIILLKLSGRILDNEQTSRLISEVENTLSDKINKIVLDIENLEYINSNGLNCFIQLLTKARNMGGDAVIVNVPEKIQNLLLISKLNTVFTIKDSVDKANEILTNSL